MLARGVYGPAGQFVGVVVATLPLSAFADFFASITLPTDASFMLLRRDGIVLVRHPDIGDRAGERMPQGSPWYGLAAAGGGSYTSPGYFDGVERLIAVQPLADYPLVMDVGLATQSALARWRVEAVAVAAGTLVASGILLLLLHALRLQFIRLQRSRRALVARNFDLTRTEARLQAASGELATTLAAMDQGLLMVDAEGTVAVCNARAEEMLDLPAGLMASRPSFVAIAARSTAADAANAVPARAVGQSARDAVRSCQTPAGAVLEVRRVALPGGGFVATFDDVTARRQAEARVVFLARHDPLTGLANRAAFVERLGQMVAQAGHGAMAAVLCLGLDRFKAVNDTLGHPIGDLLLRKVAERVGGCLGEADTVARFGGDEFAILQAGPRRIEDVALLARRIIEAISVPYDLDGQQAVIGGSVGIAVLPADGSVADVALKHADIALYRAKADGRGAFRFFAPEMDAHLQERHRLELDLLRAVGQNEFELFYQPMVNLSTERVCAFEALLRWNHPTRGMLLPGSSWRPRRKPALSCRSASG